MSRRDTILIAVLVNAGLLLVLFATAMRSDKEPSSGSSLPLAGNSQERSENPIALVPSLQIPSSERDSEESLLNQFASIPTLSDAPTEEILFSTDLPSTFLPEKMISSAPSVPVSPPFIPSSSSDTAASCGTYTVKKGDVLEKIAKSQGTTVTALLKANNLSSTSLKIGQVLKVPGKEATQPVINSSEGSYYTVKEGDSPWIIASKNNVKLDELLRLNNLDEQKARRLRPGDRLRIR